ncbi:hypothetical protein RSPO_m00206 (plasmid) [Ralstonia solanacearum Po82]|uniref:Uncharacterized protein n=1 Tax=Ralstonia solanacearum (strain Po82) TaxID=1031711 RepID=F6G896_RALS8|nr:hypothetical protein RSPO_m00206 [Ralstonia solanacearum Po82]
MLRGQRTARAVLRKRMGWQIDMRVARLWGGAPAAGKRGRGLKAPDRQGCRGASRGGVPFRQGSRPRSPVPCCRLAEVCDPVARVGRMPADRGPRCPVSS